MKLPVLNRVLGLSLLLLFSFSCASDLDYNQVNDLKLEPVFVANLAYFDIPANGFVTNGVEQNLIFDTADVDVFKDNFFRDNLKKVIGFFFTHIEVSYLINDQYRWAGNGFEETVIFFLFFTFLL